MTVGTAAAAAATTDRAFLDQPTRLFLPFAKVDKKERMVFGFASTDTLDADGEEIAVEAISAALPDYMRFGNIREMHQPHAVGKAKQADMRKRGDKEGLYLGAKIVDPTTWEKIEEGVLNGFSIGGRKVEKVGNQITKLVLSEISVVDRPANPDCTFDVVKAEDLSKLAPEVEACVLALKDKPEIDNPYAVCNWMREQGVKMPGTKQEADTPEFWKGVAAYQAESLSRLRKGVEEVLEGSTPQDQDPKPKPVEQKDTGHKEGFSKMDAEQIKQALADLSQKVEKMGEFLKEHEGKKGEEGARRDEAMTMLRRAVEVAMAAGLDKDAIATTLAGTKTEKDAAGNSSSNEDWANGPGKAAVQKMIDAAVAKGVEEALSKVALPGKTKGPQAAVAKVEDLPAEVRAKDAELVTKAEKDGDVLTLIRRARTGVDGFSAE